MATILNNLGSITFANGDYLTAQRFVQESLKITRELGDKVGVAGTLRNLGLLLKEQNLFQNAFRVYLESWEIFHELHLIG